MRSLTISRRKLLSGALAIGLGGYFVARGFFRGSHPDIEILVASLVDHLFPKNDPFPGGIELDLHNKFLVKAKDWRTKIWLEMLADGLTTTRYLTLTPDQQISLIQDALNKESRGQADNLGKAIRYTLDSCAKQYFTDPRVWPALQYKIPQPTGYPEYSRCTSNV